MRQSKQKTIPEWVWNVPIHSYVNVHSTQNYIIFYDHRSQLNGLSLNERWQTTKVVLYFVILSACHSYDYRHLSNAKFYLFGDSFVQFERFLLNGIIKGQSLITRACLRSVIRLLFIIIVTVKFASSISTQIIVRLSRSIFNWIPSERKL